RLRRVARDCGAAERVEFTGRRERAALREFYVAADVFVTTPWYEPFGITPLEAMACGTPVVGSAVGGIQHTVVEGVTGYLVPPRDPESLAEALAYLQANPSHAAALGRAGVRRVRSTFTWERVAEELAEVYTSVIHRPQPARASNTIRLAEPTAASVEHRLGASA
ncbi:MAG: glycosyltransferase, partial [Gammaproteobacteria bacterium]